MCSDKAITTLEKKVKSALKSLNFQRVDFVQVSGRPGGPEGESQGVEPIGINEMKSRVQSLIQGQIKTGDVFETIARRTFESENLLCSSVPEQIFLKIRMAHLSLQLTTAFQSKGLEPF